MVSLLPGARARRRAYIAGSSMPAMTAKPQYAVNEKRPRQQWFGPVRLPPHQCYTCVAFGREKTMNSRSTLSGVVAGISLLCVSTMLLSPRLNATENSSGDQGLTSTTMTDDCASCSVDAGTASSAFWVVAYTGPNCTGIAIPMPWQAALAACLLGLVGSIELFPIIVPCINCP